MNTKQPTSTAHIDYGLDTLFGRITKSAECQVGLEQIEDDPSRFALRVHAPCRRIWTRRKLYWWSCRDGGSMASSAVPSASMIKA